MKLAFSSNAFTNIPLVEAMHRIKEIGYEGVEIMADQPHLWPPDATHDLLARVREETLTLKLAFSNMNGFMMKAVGDIHHPSWIEPEEEKRKERMQHTLACLDLAEKLDVPSVSTEPGGPLEKMSSTEGLALFSQGLQEVLPQASTCKAKLLIEPEPDLLLERMEDTVSLIHALGNPAGLGINFDIGHFFCVGDDPAELIRRYASWLDHVHIEDIAADRIHHHLIPGKGAIDFASIFQALFEVNYDGFVTVELYPYEEMPQEAATEAYRFLTPYLKG